MATKLNPPNNQWQLSLRACALFIVAELDIGVKIQTNQIQSGHVAYKLVKLFILYDNCFHSVKTYTDQGRM